MSWDAARTVVVYNPKAAGGRVGEQWDTTAKMLRASLGDVGTVATESIGDAMRCAREAVEGGATTVLSYGGDGTHNEVVNGILASGAKDITLGILPGGTGGDFRRMLNNSRDALTSARGLPTARRDRIDVGLVRYRTDDGRTEERHVLNIASFGIAGLVDRMVNSGWKGLGGTATFFLGTLRALTKYTPAKVKLWVDDKELGVFEITNIAVCNGRFAGGGMMFAPDARLGDGLLDVIVLQNANPLRTVSLSGALYQGKHLGSSLVKFARGRHVRAECVTEATAWIDIDGEAPGTLPIEVEVVPGALFLLDAKDGVV